MPLILPKSRFFPPAELAESEGVVLFGGKLSPEWLLDAYAHGIFPWPIFEGTDVMVWWSPDPRAVFEFDQLHISRRLARRIRSGRFQVTCNRNFKAVISGCATTGDRRYNTWLTPKMQAAYLLLHQQGHAHSIEVWQDKQLVGGTYGVAIGGLFAAESMFHLETDASKVALVYLLHHLRMRGYTIVDIQQLTPHTASLGACEISRDTYLKRVAQAVGQPATFGTELEKRTEKQQVIAH